MRWQRVLSVSFLIISPLSALGCDDAETNGSERPGLDRRAAVYDAYIAARAASGDNLDPGLWLTVHNDLPVIRQDAEIISQAFLEAEVVAPDRRHLAAEGDKNRRGRSEPVGGDDQDAAASPPALRYLLQGKVLSESETSFWISPQQLDALADKSGGEIWFNVKDSVQVSSFPFPCWLDGGGAVSRVSASSGSSVQRLTLRVHGRHRFSYKCSLQ